MIWRSATRCTSTTCPRTTTGRIWPITTLARTVSTPERPKELHLIFAFLMAFAVASTGCESWRSDIGKLRTPTTPTETTLVDCWDRRSANIGTRFGRTSTSRRTTGTV
uniref:(northern house mosquito) hypothetical protein n=1 Tax=Culex pipiens TaxID=7175 RepID=A0A8D8B361_CULPI